MTYIGGLDPFQADAALREANRMREQWVRQQWKPTIRIYRGIAPGKMRFECADNDCYGLGMTETEAYRDWQRQKDRVESRKVHLS